MLHTCMFHAYLPAHPPQACFMEAILDGNLNTGADDYKMVIRCLRRHTWSAPT